MLSWSHGTAEINNMCTLDSIPFCSRRWLKHHLTDCLMGVNLLFIFLLLYVYVCPCTHVRAHVWRSEVTSVNQFSPGFTWDPGMELRQPGFTTAPLRHLRCHQSPKVSLSFQFRHLPRAEPVSVVLDGHSLVKCCSETANRETAPSERRLSMVGQKHPATTYTFAWSPVLVLIFAQSY